MHETPGILIRTDAGTGETDEVHWEDVKESLANYYKDINLVAEYLLEGNPVRTPFYFYKIKPQETP